MRPEPARRPTPKPAPKPAPRPSPAPLPRLKLPGAPAKRLLLAAALAITAAVTTNALLGTFDALSWLPQVPAQELSTAQIEARLEAFQSAGSIQLEAVDPRDLDEALRSMGLESPEQTRQLHADLQAGSVRLAWVELRDDVAEDGDVVAVLAGEFARVIPIANAPARIVLPIPANLQQIQVRGVQDGGGGITVAVKTPTGVVPLPRLLVGQVINVPIY